MSNFAFGVQFPTETQYILSAFFLVSFFFSDKMYGFEVVIYNFLSSKRWVLVKFAMSEVELGLRFRVILGHITYHECTAS